MQQNLVVVGNGMAGMRAVEEIIKIAPEHYDITVFGAEPHGNYNRIMLTPVLFGAKTVDEIMIHDFNWYKKNNITLHCGEEKSVVDIDRDNHVVIAKDGTKANYDKLIMATGSLPFMLPIPGKDVEGVMGFRDIADVEQMIAKSKTHQHAVILGGGLLGLEAANGLQKRGMTVSVVNRAGHLLNKQLDKVAGGFLKNQLEVNGLSFHLNNTITQIHSQNNHIKEVVLTDGTIIPTDILVMSTGIKPNISLAQNIGLSCEKGILVDDHMQTSDPAIFSIGECIQHRGELFGLVAPVYDQAKVCANFLTDQNPAGYQSISPATMLKVTGIDLFSVGNFEGDETTESITFTDPILSVYKKIVIKNQRIIGMLMYGDTTDNAWFLNLLKNQTDISSIREQLIFGKTEFPEAA